MSGGVLVLLEFSVYEFFPVNAQQHWWAWLALGRFLNII
jgi:hypothetical protein